MKLHYCVQRMKLTIRKKRGAERTYQYVGILTMVVAFIISSLELAKRKGTLLSKTRELKQIRNNHCDTKKPIKP